MVSFMKTFLGASIIFCVLGLTAPFLYAQEGGEGGGASPAPAPTPEQQAAADFQGAKDAAKEYAKEAWDKLQEAKDKLEAKKEAGDIDEEEYNRQKEEIGKAKAEVKKAKEGIENAKTPEELKGVKIPLPNPTYPLWGEMITWMPLGKVVEEFAPLREAYLRKKIEENDDKEEREKELDRIGDLKKGLGLTTVAGVGVETKDGRPCGNALVSTLGGIKPQDPARVSVTFTPVNLSVMNPRDFSVVIYDKVGHVVAAAPFKQIITKPTPGVPSGKGKEEEGEPQYVATLPCPYTPAKTGGGKGPTPSSTDYVVLMPKPTAGATGVATPGVPTTTPTPGAPTAGATAKPGVPTPPTGATGVPIPSPGAAAIAVIKGWNLVPPPLNVVTPTIPVGPSTGPRGSGVATVGTGGDTKDKDLSYTTVEDLSIGGLTITSAAPDNNTVALSGDLAFVLVGGPAANSIRMFGETTTTSDSPIVSTIGVSPTGGADLTALSFSPAFPTDDTVFMTVDTPSPTLASTGGGARGGDDVGGGPAVVGVSGPGGAAQSVGQPGQQGSWNAVPLTDPPSNSSALFGATVATNGLIGISPMRSLGPVPEGTTVVYFPAGGIPGGSGAATNIGGPGGEGEPPVDCAIGIVDPRCKE